MAVEHTQTHVVDDLRAEQRRRWLAGDRVPVETILSQHPELATREEDVIELIAGEVHLRQSQGEQPDRAEYIGRFPGQASRLESVFQNHETLDSIARGSTRRDPAGNDEAGNGVPSAILETAVHDGRAARSDVMLATASIGSLVDGNAATHLRATASLGHAPTRPNGSSPTAQAPSASASAPATAIGRYTVKKILGEGAFGLVYLAFDPDLKRDVAIKVPHPHLVASLAAAESYLSEAQNVARLDHPGIVPVYDVGRTEEGKCYVVSKYIPGGSLDRFMKERRPFAESALLVAQIAEALHHAHHRGLVHRDIKPANILIDEAGHPLVADFGLALKDEEFGKGGAFSGTPAYMSPEQARREGHVVDARSDIYSLGVVLFELLIGRLPYRSKTVTDLLNEVVTVESRPPRQLDDSIPDALDQICNKALSKRPADRYSTALDMAKALRAAVAGPSEKARPVRRFALAAGVAAALIGAFWFVRSQPGVDRAVRGPNVLAATVSGDAASRDAVSGDAAAGALAENLPAAASAPPVRLEIHCQRKSEDESVPFHNLSAKDPPLSNGDRVQVHVRTARPQYLYVYWYDPQGQSRRLWPEDPGSQQERTELAFPSGGSDKWFTIEGGHGNEMVIVGGTEKPLSAAALAALEQTPSFAAGSHTVKSALLLPVSGIERGLGAVVTSRKTPLDTHFEDLLRADFATYRGIVVPHE